MNQLIEKRVDLRIRGDVLKTARESCGLDEEALANAVCLKSWHINQMENAEGHYYFYSMELKVRAAKKIGKYLGLEESSYLHLI
jgi:ribosome-binding protein aMBF1 (putative translation factor)